MRRNWRYHLFAFFLPALYEISIGMILRHASGPPYDNMVKLDIGMYEHSLSYYSYNEEASVLGRHYQDIIRRRYQTYSENVVNVSDSIIEKGTNNIHFYHSNLIVAAELNKTGNFLRNIFLVQLIYVFLR